VVSRYDNERWPERAQEARRRLVLLAPAAVGEVARRQDEGRVDAVDQLRDRSLELGLMECLPRSDMQVRDVEDAC
jgi:hypothetical protein